MLGQRFHEIGRGYVKKSKSYSCPYITGIDINDHEKPFVLAMGAHHSDAAATLVSCKELISDKWKEHIRLSNCELFVEQLKQAMENNEPFPQNFIFEIINGNNS